MLTIPRKTLECRIRRPRVLSVVLLAGSMSVPTAMAMVVARLDAADAPEPVRVRPLVDEYSPAAAVGVVAWAQERPNELPNDAYVRVGNERPIKINRPSTNAYPGSFDGDSLVFQQTDEYGDDSDLWLYNTTSGARRPLAGTVNTRAWEWQPHLDGDWLFFGRGKIEGLFATNKRTLVLRNLLTGKERVLAQARGLNPHLFTGGIRDDIAVWTVCGTREGRAYCASFRHDIAAKETLRLPDGGAPRQFAATVTPGGRIYAVRADPECGKAVRLVRLDLGAPAVLIRRFGDGAEPSQLTAFEDRPAGTRIYFDRWNCKTERWDIMRLLDPS